MQEDCCCNECPVHKKEILVPKTGCCENGSGCCSFKKCKSKPIGINTSHTYR
jgi:hypothetical protein